MKKLLVSAFSVALPVLSLFALESDTGLVRKWRFNDGWKPFLPLATAETVEIDGSEALHLFNAEGRDGCMIYATKVLPARAGDVVRLRLEAKGRGFAKMTCYRRGPAGEWVGEAGERKLDLSDQWTAFELKAVLRDQNERVLAGFEPALGIEKGSEAYFRNIRVVRDLVAGEVEFKDDFESSASRPGAPRIVRDYIAPGLLVETSLGAYRTSSSQELMKSAKFGVSTPGAFPRIGFRLYALAGDAAPGRLEAAFGEGDAALRFSLAPSDNLEALVGEVTGGRKFRLSTDRLPADFFFSLTPSGDWELEVKSLSDSSSAVIGGVCPSLAGSLASLVRSLRLVSLKPGVETMARVDNLLLGAATFASQSAVTYPFVASPEPNFDPVKAGWPLVFNEDFEGDSLDLKKWNYSYGSARDYVDLKDGALRIKADFPPGGDGTKLATGSIRTREKFLYGYFEARLKFTHESGWWAAFWLCENGISNPFLDGFEIDIFEDYYTRVLRPGEGPHPHIIDHNLHTYVSGTLKSWNYNSVFAPDSLGDAAFDEWHVIAVKWTPFEITYYFDGKAIRSKSKVSHSPYETVTFDAFRHSADTAPLRAILSGQIMKQSYKCHDPRGFKFPEYYLVDRVRIYGWPGSEKGAVPAVELSGTIANNAMVRPGDEVVFEAKSTPAKSGAPIRAVHLFDDGCYLFSVTNPPYRFALTMDENSFNRTTWPRGGRQNISPVFEGSIHAFAALAEDAEGQVGFSEPIVAMLAPPVTSKPRDGTPQRLPGKLVVSRYDEGGEGVAYHDSTGKVGGNDNTIGSMVSGEWINYTVEVEKAGEYEISLPYGTPYDTRQRLTLMLDQRHLTTLEIHPHAAAHFGCDTLATAPFHLPAGRHVITFVCLGSFNFSNPTFTLIRCSNGPENDIL